MSRAALATRTLAAKVEAILRNAGAVPGVEGYPGQEGYRIVAPEPAVCADPPTWATAYVLHMGPADTDWTPAVEAYYVALVAAELKAWVIPADYTVEGVPYVVVQRPIAYPGKVAA